MHVPHLVFAALVQQFRLLRLLRLGGWGAQLSRTAEARQSSAEDRRAGQARAREHADDAPRIRVG